MNETLELNDTPPAIVRFLDRFLQEKNIQWLLVLGALILISSSFMLVARYWDDGFFSAPLKGMVMLAYAVVIEQTGWWALNRLRLPKTGAAFLALTACLIPLVFFAVQWVYREGDQTSFQSVAAYIGLLIAATAFAVRAAIRIFDHFLHKTPSTFLLSYLLLSLGGALMPLVPPTPVSAMTAAAAFWAVFFIGSVKISRHTFWLVESRRFPRIFGFFPIGLLGLLFLSLVSFRLGARIEREWIGCGLALTALPFLLTADSVASVFQQRSGNLIRPFPWSIIAPMILGLVLCALGLGLAMSGLAPGHDPLAISPTALIAAIVAGLVAARTGRPAFVWGMLFLITLAYQFLPVYFRQSALEILQQGDSAVQETKLPPGFYGSTYLPLILTLSLAATRLEMLGRKVFVAPIQRFSGLLALGLLVLACSDPKALFPVAVAMVGVFALQTRLFRQPVFATAGIVSWVLAAFGLESFTRFAFDLDFSASRATLNLAFAFILLLWPGGKIDRSLTGLDGKPRQFCRMTSLAGALLLPAAWWLDSAPHAEWMRVAVPCLLLLLHSVYWRRAGLSGYTLTLLYVGGVLLAPGFGLDAESILIGCLCSLVAQWLVGYALERRPDWLLSRAFGSANRYFVGTWLPVAAVCIVLPLIGFETLRSAPWESEWLAVSLAVTVGVFDVARRTESRVLLWLGTGLVLSIGSSLLAPAALKWSGVLWVFLMLGATCLLRWLERRSDTRVPGFFRNRLDPGFIRLLTLALLPGLFVFDAALLAAGGLATAGLLTVYANRAGLDRNRIRAVANWQIITAIVAWTAPSSVHNLLAVCSRPEPSVFLAYALGTAVSLVFWQTRAGFVRRAAEGVVHRFLLRTVGLTALCFAMQLPAGRGLLQIELVATFLLWIVCELHAAWMRQRRIHVWSAQALLGVLGVYCGRAFDLGGQTGLFVLFLLALGQSALSDRLKDARGWCVYSDSFRVVGSFLSAVVVVAGLLQPVAASSTLAMLGVAAYCFYRGRMQNRPFPVVLAGLIAYLVTVHWAHALALRDPQVFLIPAGATLLALTRTLRVEIDPVWQNRLYSVGALMILVSPVFSMLHEISWMPMCSLLLASVLVIVLAIGFRVRALIYTGTAFLFADLLAMAVRSTLENPHLLPVLGVGLGIAVLALAAWSERHRENLLQRMRILSAELQQWA